MFLMIPEAPNAFKWMFFDALEIQEQSWIDPGSIWEKSFFHEIFQNFEPYDEVEFHKNSYVYQRSGQSESTQTSSNSIRPEILRIIKFYRADVEKNKKQNWKEI